VKLTKIHTSDIYDHPIVQSLPRTHSVLSKFLRGQFRLSNPLPPIRQYHFGTLNNDTDLVGYSHSPSVRLHASRLGLPIGEVLSMYRLGSLHCPDLKLAERLGATNTIGAVDLESFQLRVSPGHIGVSLTDSVLSSRPSRHPWAAVYSAILSGSVKVTTADAEGGIATKSLRTVDGILVRQLCNAESPMMDRETVVVHRDLSFYLGVSLAVIFRYKQLCFLPRGPVCFKDIWSFQEEFITLSEIRSRLKVEGRNVWPKEIGRAIQAAGYRRIDPTAGVFLRTEVESWISEETANFRRKLSS